MMHIIHAWKGSRVAIALCLVSPAAMAQTSSHHTIVSDTVRLVVVEELPRSDVIGLLEIEPDGNGRTVNTLTIGRRNVSRGAVYAGIVTLNAVRDRHIDIIKDAVIPVRRAFDERRMSRAALKYVNAYINRLSPAGGTRRVVIPLRAVATDRVNSR